MNIAFLFNSDFPDFNNYYGPPICELILSANVLQTCDRHMRVSVGDILTYGFAGIRTYNELFAVCKALYQPTNYDNLLYEKLEPTYTSATVYSWLFQNMESKIADELHKELLKHESYLGAMDVDFANPMQLNFFRNSLVELYRIKGTTCSVFYLEGEQEEYLDVVEKENFESNGFEIDMENIGLRRTIFDNYNELEHFQRIKDFANTFHEFNDLDSSVISDLILNLEEIHPKLFESLSAAAKVLSTAETEDEFAQASLTGRRFLENLADFLFPPSKENWNGRKVGKQEYKNRIWAYIEQTIQENGLDGSKLKEFGLQVDDLVERFNKELHGDVDKGFLESAFTELIVWLSNLIEFNSESIRRPYLAYEQNLKKMLNLNPKNA